MNHDQDKLVGFPCSLCKKKAFYPANGDSKIRFSSLLEHVRNDLGYRPYYCAQTNCIGSWPSQRLLEKHHQSTHPDKALLIFNQRLTWLDKHCERITTLLFPSVLNTSTQTENLIDYVKSEAASSFIKDLHAWWKNVHLEYLFKSVTSEEDNEDENERADPLIKRVKLEPVVYHPAEGTSQPLIIELDDSQREQQQQPSGQPTEATDRPKQKKHVYAKYVNANAVGSKLSRSRPRKTADFGGRAAMLGSKRPRGRPRKNPSAAANIKAKPDRVQQSSRRQYNDHQELGNLNSPTSCRGGRKISSMNGSTPRKATWSAFNKRWRIRNGAIDSIASDLGETSASVPLPVSKKSSKVEGSKDKRLRRACALCGIRVLQVSERKHIESHLQQNGEFRYECLLCLADPKRPKEKHLRTMFEDTIKIRHIPCVHGVPKPIDGVHFRDYTVEHGLKEKRRGWHERCFPAIADARNKAFRETVEGEPCLESSASTKLSKA